MIFVRTVIKILLGGSLLALVRSWDDMATWAVDDTIDPEENTDPFDMGSYDPSAKYHSGKQSDSERRIPRKNKWLQVGSGEDEVEEVITKTVAWTVCGDKCKDGVDPISDSGLSVISKEQKVVHKGSCRLPLDGVDQTSTKVHLRRIVKRLLAAMGLKLDSEMVGILHVPLIAKVDSASLRVLENFVSVDINEANMKDVDDILSNLFEKGDDCILEQKYCIEVDSWRNFFSSFKRLSLDMLMNHLDIWLAITLVLALVLVAVYASRLSPLYVSVVLVGAVFFCMSWHSHYQLLMQRAMAKRQSDMVRMSTIPLECKPHEMEMLQSVWHWTKTSIFMADNPCEKYHEILLVDPTLEVTALVALWDLTATILFHPLDHIGEKSGKFFANFLGNISFFKGVVVMIVVGIISMFVLLMLCGYQIRFPFWLGGIEPATRQYAPVPAQRVEDITDQVVESISKRFSAMTVSNPQGSLISQDVSQQREVQVVDPPGQYTLVDRQGQTFGIRRPSNQLFMNQMGYIEPVPSQESLSVYFQNQPSNGISDYPAHTLRYRPPIVEVASGFVTSDCFVTETRIGTDTYVEGQVIDLSCAGAAVHPELVNRQESEVRNPTNETQVPGAKSLHQSVIPGGTTKLDAGVANQLIKAIDAGDNPLSVLQESCSRLTFVSKVGCDEPSEAKSSAVEVIGQVNPWPPLTEDSDSEFEVMHEVVDDSV